MPDTLYKRCRRCAAGFKRSRADTTVYCPACRKAQAQRREDRRAGVSKTVVCFCGKTVYVDGFGIPTGQECPRECEKNRDKVPKRRKR